jgi:hypothetical protein
MPSLTNPTDNMQVRIPGLNLGDIICSGNSEDKNRTCSVPWLANYIGGIYKYLLGIGALLATITMMVGGFLWIMSSGNPQAIGDAKGWINGAVIGLILLSTTWLILNEVNPELTRLKSINIKMIDKKEFGQGCGENCGKCEVPTDPDNKCSVAYLTANGGDCFGSDINKIAAICNIESQGNQNATGNADACKYTVNGTTQTSSFSFGLFQINAVNSASIIPECRGAFSGEVSGNNCYERTTNSAGITYCKYFMCKPLAGAQQCITALRSPINNIKAACELYRERKLQPWSAVTTKLCGF